VIQTFHPHVGGTEKQLLSLLPLFSKQQFKTIVITRRLPGTASSEQINGAMVYRCPALPGKRLSSVSFIVFALIRLSLTRPDCVHAFQLLSPLTIAILYRALTNTPIICKVQGGGPKGDLARVKKKLFSGLRLHWLKSQVDSYQVISKEIFMQLKSIGIPENKLNSIPNGVVLDRFTPVASDIKKSEIRSQLDLDDNDLVFITVGRLVALKNIQLLIDVWTSIEQSTESNIQAMVAKARPSLLIVGDGPEKHRLMQSANNSTRIRFLGQRDDIRTLLQAADVLTHVSISEGQSNNISEGLSSGLAILATHVGAAEDQVRPGYNGWLVEPNNHTSLANGIVSVMQSTEKLTQMGKNSRQLISEKYDINKTVQLLTEEYQRLAKLA